MDNKREIQLGVNVDHIATLRQARGVNYPDPQQAAQVALDAGADGVTVHLREDRRHIQDQDVINIRKNVALPMNFEMAATEEMLNIAIKTQPHECCIVPEKREELTTEGGLNVQAQSEFLKGYVSKLKRSGALVSLFIDPEISQVDASKEVGADIVELHTGNYAECVDQSMIDSEFSRIKLAAEHAADLGLQVNAGHGLHYENVQRIAAIPELTCLNIGHSIVAYASIHGFHEAVCKMKALMNQV